MIALTEFEAPPGVLPLTSDKSPNFIALPVVEIVILSILPTFPSEVFPPMQNP